MNSPAVGARKDLPSIFLNMKPLSTGAAWLKIIHEYTPDFLRSISRVLKRFRDLAVTPTWGSQSWLQPPFEAAPRSTIEMDLVVAKPRLCSRLKRPPEKAAAAMIGCPTSAS